MESRHKMRITGEAGGTHGDAGVEPSTAILSYQITVFTTVTAPAHRARLSFNEPLIPAVSANLAGNYPSILYTTLITPMMTWSETFVAHTLSSLSLLPLTP